MPQGLWESRDLPPNAHSCDRFLSKQMHPISVLTFAIFFLGYATARFDLIIRLYELALFAWDRGVITRAAKGFAILTFVFLLVLIPVDRVAKKEAELVGSIRGYSVVTKLKHCA